MKLSLIVIKIRNVKLKTWDCRGEFWWDVTAGKLWKLKLRWKQTEEKCKIHQAKPRSAGWISRCVELSWKVSIKSRQSMSVLSVLPVRSQVWSRKQGNLEPSLTELASAKVLCSKLENVVFLMFTSQGGISSYDEFKKVFANNKKLIEEFVVESDMMSMETLENWVEMKAKRTNQQPKPSRGANQLNGWKVGCKAAY